MLQTKKLDQLIEALETLSPADRDAMLRRLRAQPATLPSAALVVINNGKAEAGVDSGLGSMQGLSGSGGTLAMPIPPLPIVRGSETPTVPDASGMPTAPKSLVSLRLSAPKGDCDLGIDLRGWLANAARCGWPFAFYRQNEAPQTRWQFDARAVFPLALAKSHSIDVVVIGLGVDLSELAERFALVFEAPPPDGKGKAKARAGDK